MSKHVTITNISQDGIVISALGGEISTQPGTTIELYDKRKNMEESKNVSLIEKVIKSGHMSILEHINLSLLMTNVSVCVEEFFIQHRLASFTVKSRRYVDFSNSGYYVPDDLPNDEFKKIYKDDMDMLFDTYTKLLESNIPKEDARFILPYSFYSNFVVTVNARELIHIMKRIITEYENENVTYAPSISDYVESELGNIYDEVISELKEKLPFLADVIEKEENSYDPKAYEPKYLNLHSSFSAITHPTVDVIDDNSEIRYLALEKVLSENNGISLKDKPVELEFLNYFITVHNVSMSTITHLLRHRMCSINIKKSGLNKFIYPDSIKSNGSANALYVDALKAHKLAIREMIKIDGDRKYTQRPSFNQYLRLSGSTTDVHMNMNAGELMIFCKLRCCNRAQWEIRMIADSILNQLRTNHEIFMGFGPSCHVLGKCPEGKMTCGKFEEVTKRYSH